MPRRSRFFQYAIQVLALTCALGTSALVRAAEDPSLQLYLDFESFEWEDPPGWWLLRDQSRNRFRVTHDNFGVPPPTIVTAKFGHALQVRGLANTAFVHTNGVSIYKAGQGITVSIWVRLPDTTVADPSSAAVSPIFVGGKDFHNKPLVSTFVGRSEKGPLILRWRAYQKDGATLAFDCVAEETPSTDWFHYAAVYDPKAKRALVYLDGREVARADAIGRPVADWGAGRRVSNVAMETRRRGPDGRDNSPLFVDELRFYARAFSVREVRMLMLNPFDVSPRTKLATQWGALKSR